MLASWNPAQEAPNDNTGFVGVLGAENTGVGSELVASKRDFFKMKFHF